MRILICAIFPTILIPFLSGVVLALDQVQTVDGIPPWALGTGIISGIIGGPAFAVWFSWYMTTKRVPAMERKHAEQLTATEERFSLQIKSNSERYALQTESSEKRHADHIALLITDFRSDLKELWKYKREDEIRLVGAIEKLDESLSTLANEVQKTHCKYGERAIHAQ